MDEKDSALVAAVRELTGELRRRRRRSRLLWLALGALLLALAGLAQFGDGREGAGAPHVARIDIYGPILPEAPANADWVGEALRDAFAAPQARAVLLHLDSPGGSPLQAQRVHAEIGRLRAAHPDKKVYAVAGDLCTSAAYYIAAAADEIYAGESSIVGSIGVVAGGFGFVEALRKLGVERRLTTAGERKAMLDPFLPEAPADRAHLQALVDELHGQFVAAVKRARGARLAAADAEVFDGRFWSGRQARALGLVDGFDDARGVARDRVGVEEIVNYTREEELLERLAERVAARLGLRLEGALRAPLRF